MSPEKFALSELEELLGHKVWPVNKYFLPMFVFRICLKNLQGSPSSNMLPFSPLLLELNSEILKRFGGRKERSFCHNLHNLKFSNLYIFATS